MTGTFKYVLNGEKSTAVFRDENGNSVSLYAGWWGVWKRGGTLYGQFERLEDALNKMAELSV